jgi:hypothetical protein
VSAGVQQEVVDIDDDVTNLLTSHKINLTFLRREFVFILK